MLLTNASNANEQLAKTCTGILNSTQNQQQISHTIWVTKIDITKGPGVIPASDSYNTPSPRKAYRQVVVTGPITRPSHQLGRDGIQNLFVHP